MLTIRGVLSDNISGSLKGCLSFHPVMNVAIICSVLASVSALGLSKSSWLDVNGDWILSGTNPLVVYP